MFADIAVQHWAFTVYVIGAICICLTMIGLAALLGGRAYGRAKNKPFESGVDSVGNARLRFSAKFYLVAMFFVIFDVEALYLFHPAAGRPPLPVAHWCPRLGPEKACPD
jgi:NADH-quinone oxidoreductase subunit A